MVIGYIPPEDDYVPADDSEYEVIIDVDYSNSDDSSNDEDSNADDS